MPPKGRPAKKKRNISGLRNQGSSESKPTDSNPPSTSSTSQSYQWDRTTINKKKPLYKLKEEASSEKGLSDSESESDLELDDENDGIDTDWKGFMNAEFKKRLAKQYWDIKEKENDMEWLPYKLRVMVQGKQAVKKGRPKVYQKGPNIMSKPARTQRDHKELIRNQSNLDRYLNMPIHSPGPSTPIVPQMRKASKRSTSSHETIEPDLRSNSSIEILETSGLPLQEDTPVPESEIYEETVNDKNNNSIFDQQIETAHKTVYL
ncbi:hypothetical protein JR316_0002768 [Psilocybe cubensis]|uniref:Uncharacterized protein n=2 Tax=Psilocybe cubensis TaxID=181762 RepID=A0A8H7Y8W7_PSICU|nr:hypothetical protein JR316_0002768 [Psilocybe cubensis]KAH9485853.1 hypothetical protein JR316_0002768 [Psilocybe cubensis]